MTTTTTTALHRLVADLDELRRHWEERPLVSTGLGHLDDVFSLDTVEELLAGRGLVLSFARLFRDGEQPQTATLSRPRERGGPHTEPLLDGGKTLEAVASGATLVLEELQSYCPGVASFARELTAATGCHVYSAAFLTPANARGAAPHYDLASVFIRQVFGSKRWRVGRPLQRWPKRPWNGRQVALEDTLECVLHAGDCLYIPRGYIHVGDATDEASLHLSLGLTPVTWEKVFRRLVGNAAEDERLRQALPFGFPAGDDGELAALFLEKARIVAEYLQGRPPQVVADEIRRAFDPGGDERLAEPSPAGLRAALLHAQR